MKFEYICNYLLENIFGAIVSNMIVEKTHVNIILPIS